MDSWDMERWRELWLLAIGAGFMDSQVRGVLLTIPAPALSWIGVLKRGMDQRDLEKVWHSMEYGWKVGRNGNKRVIDAVLDELPRIPYRERRNQLLDEVLLLRSTGDLTGAELAYAKLQKLLGGANDVTSAKLRAKEICDA